MGYMMLTEQGNEDKQQQNVRGMRQAKQGVRQELQSNEEMRDKGRAEEQMRGDRVGQAEG